MKVLAGLAITAALSLFGACGGAPNAPSTPATTSDPGAGSAASAPTCEEVVAHVKQLSITASGATTDAQKDQAARDVEPALLELADECAGGTGEPAGHDPVVLEGWSASFRRCVIAARSREDVAECDKASAAPSGAL